MRHLRTPSLFLALMAFSSFAFGAKDPTDQISLSIDAIGQGVMFSNGQGVPQDPQFGLGGSTFLDWRFDKVISLGLGGAYTTFPGSGIQLSSLDVGGRFFPYVMPQGEIYVQGGVGLTTLFTYTSNTVWGHYHGYAGVGYRHFVGDNMALDLGAQYDFYSPIGAAANGVGAKLGLTFLFGKTRYPSDLPEDATMMVGQDRFAAREPSVYFWRIGDSLKGIAARELGAEGLYPMIVDANGDLFANIGSLRVGSKLLIPRTSLTDAQMDDVTLKALSERYMRLARIAVHRPYATRPGWNGPKTYRWKTGDDMKSVAGKLYDDEDLYPILVDANEARLIHPVALVPGVLLTVPAPPADEFVEQVHELSWDKSYFIWWRNVSDKDRR